MTSGPCALNLFLSPFSTLIARFSWRHFTGGAVDLARKCVAVLLVYATVAGTMPVRADEPVINLRGGGNSIAVLPGSFRTPEWLTRAREKQSLEGSAGNGRSLAASPEQALPLIAEAGVPRGLLGKSASLRSTLPHIFGSIVGSGTTSSILSNFNGTSIAGGNYIWFNCVLKSRADWGLRRSTFTFAAQRLLSPRAESTTTLRLRARRSLTLHPPQRRRQLSMRIRTSG